MISRLPLSFRIKLYLAVMRFYRWHNDLCKWCGRHQILWRYEMVCPNCHPGWRRANDLGGVNDERLNIPYRAKADPEARRLRARLY